MTPSVAVDLQTRNLLQVHRSVQAVAEGVAAVSAEALVVFALRPPRPVSGSTPLLQAARSLGVDIDSVCGGRPCKCCRTLLSEGEFAKHG